MKTWLVSDTHFNHHNILKFMSTRQKFSSKEEMNESIINEWNSIVAREDEVIHLGDFILGCDLGVAEEILNKLNFSHLTLIVGNHDTNNKIKYLYSTYDKISVVPMLQKDEFILTHYPIHPDLLEEYCIRSNGVNERYNIHGHIHDRQLNDKRYLNINWDVMSEDNHFIELEEAMNQLKARQ